MNDKHTGNFLFSAAIGLLAGILGTVLTLIATQNLTIPAFSQNSELNTENPSQLPMSASDNTGLTGSVVHVGSPAIKQTNNSESLSDSQSPASVDEALEEAAAERAQLAQVLAQLTRQIESVETDLINRQAPDVLEAPTSTREQADNLSRFGDFEQRRSPQDRIGSLIASGIDADRAQALQSRQDQFQLARLELFDLAEREGWTESEQFSARLEALDEQRPDLRIELGDEAYDRYLSEAGLSNRVVVDSIIPGSSADIAGLQPGDMVLSYANQRVFSTRDLQRATREGVRGESVVLSVERQAQTLFFDIPRGPLGVSLSARQSSSS